LARHSTHRRLRYTPSHSMNAFENLLCSSSLWRYLTKRHLLPSILSNAHLGDDLLEIGAGFGAATAALRERVARVTSLEYAHDSAVKLKSRNDALAPRIVQGDAAHLPFANGSFSSVVAILVLHHLKSSALQDQAFVEIFRVLRPGGTFVAFEITDSWLHRQAHFRSTFTPVVPASSVARLTSAGFAKISVDDQRGGFRLTAIK
jgi:ubiquinone/menaquinone biosynthesis C-methylase UbiE